MECKRCGHVWEPKVEIPKQCPKCKQYYYNRPREWEHKGTNEYDDIVPPIIGADKIEEVIEKVKEADKHSVKFD